MSKRGGGGSSRTATTGVRAIASVLGIARHEIGSFTQIKKEEELYPPLSRQPLTLDRSTEVTYMMELKQELLHRFHESPFFHKKAGKREVRRYTDKYRALNKEVFEPYWDRIPRELNWRRSRDGRHAAKRRKLDENAVKETLEKLAKKESENPNEEDANEKEESDKEDDEEKKDDENNDGEPISDDDYLEEDNDYVQNYFDNGDAYAEGSDDNLDEGY